MTTKTTKKKRRRHPRPSASPQVRRRAATEPSDARPRPAKPVPRRRRRRRFDPSLGQVGVVGGVVLVAALVFFGGRGSTGGEVKATTAPGFSLPSTAGGEVSLSDLAGHNVLLYFNEGVGCDACFTQTLELERARDELAAKDITLVPIVINPLDTVRAELDRFGITTPYLIDDGTASRAYGVLGKGMHANLPGHGFVFINANGKIRWQKEYPSMYASAGEVLGAIDRFVLT